VRVLEQVLTPGMQDRKESNLGAEVAGIPGELLQSLGTGAEQEVIEDLLVLQRQLGELVRQVVSRRRARRHAVRKMKVGPSEPPCRGRLQTAVSCFSQKLRW